MASQSMSWGRAWHISHDGPSIQMWFNNTVVASSNLQNRACIENVNIFDPTFEHTLASIVFPSRKGWLWAWNVWGAWSLELSGSAGWRRRGSEQSKPHALPLGCGRDRMATGQGELLSRAQERDTAKSRVSLRAGPERPAHAEGEAITCHSTILSLRASPQMEKKRRTIQCVSSGFNYRQETL